MARPLRVEYSGAFYHVFFLEVIANRFLKKTGITWLMNFLSESTQLTLMLQKSRMLQLQGVQG